MTQVQIDPGLGGVVAAETRMSRVNGLTGELLIAGYPLQSLASHAAYEDVAFMMLHGQRPNSAERTHFVNQLRQWRPLPAATVQLLHAAAERDVNPMDALRLAIDSFALDMPADVNAQEQMLLARAPVALATYARLQQGLPAIDPNLSLDRAANFLYMLDGNCPSAARVRALNTYWNTVVDHGFNASTFTARVIISTDSDRVAAVTGAIGALKGPKHGGAPGPALDMVFEIGSEAAAEPYLRAKFGARGTANGVWASRLQGARSTRCRA